MARIPNSLVDNSVKCLAAGKALGKPPVLDDPERSRDDGTFLQTKLDQPATGDREPRRLRI